MYKTACILQTLTVQCSWRTEGGMRCSDTCGGGVAAGTCWNIWKLLCGCGRRVLMVLVVAKNAVAVNEEKVKKGCPRLLPISQHL